MKRYVAFWAFFLTSIALATVEIGPNAGNGGSGDLLSTNNLSDVSDAPTARVNLGAAASGVNTDITSLNAPLCAKAGSFKFCFNGVPTTDRTYTMPDADVTFPSSFASPEPTAPYTSTTPTSATCSADCGVGEIISGGGCSNSAAVSLQDSYPSDSDTWSCEYGAATGDCTAHAICMPNF